MINLRLYSRSFRIMMQVIFLCLYASSNAKLIPNIRYRKTILHMRKVCLCFGELCYVFLCVDICQKLMLFLISYFVIFMEIELEVIRYKIVRPNGNIFFYYSGTLTPFFRFTHLSHNLSVLLSIIDFIFKSIRTLTTCVFPLWT